MNEVTKPFPCKICKQQVMVTFVPNPILGESFIRAMLVCDSCKPVGKRPARPENTEKRKSYRQPHND